MVSTNTTVAPGQLLQYKPVADASGNPKKLGQGVYGAVYEYIDTQTGERVAIKRIQLTGLQGNRAQVLQQHLLSELQEWHKLHFPHVVKLLDVFMTSDHINIVQELVEGGTLYDSINHCLRRGKPMGERSARWVFQQLVLTTEYFHKCGLSGRAFDHDNIMLKTEPGMNPIVKVADFGLSKHLNALPSVHVRVPSVRFMTPEEVTNMYMAGDMRRNSGATAVAVLRQQDIWRLGILLHELLTGSWPWPHDHRNGIQAEAWHICLTRPLPKLPASLSTECRDLLDLMLHPDPESRITVAGIKQQPWFLQDLPLGAADMVERYINRAPSCVRTLEQLQAIAQEAVQCVADANNSCR